MDEQVVQLRVEYAVTVSFLVGALQVKYQSFSVLGYKNNPDLTAVNMKDGNIGVTNKILEQESQ